MKVQQTPTNVTYKPKFRKGLIILNYILCLLYLVVALCHQKLKVPITCKIRVFESKEKTIMYAQMLEQAGCQVNTKLDKHFILPFILY